MAKSKRPEINDNNLAIAYYRYSSHSQNEMSIDQQRAQAQNYAEAHGLTIVKEYSDAAKTGTNTNRPGYQLMLAEIPTLKPHSLILWKTDRLGRDRFELVDAKRKIREAGCRIELIAEMSPTDDPESVLFEGIAESFAEYYSRTLSVNIRRGMDYNAAHALYNGHKVFGYEGKPHEPYSVDPRTAPAVQKMFADYAAGEPMQGVCDALNAAGYRTVKGGPFGVKTLSRMLRNRHYIGEYSESGVTIPDGMPRLVDDATFQAVQTRLLENRKRKSSKRTGTSRYWLSGKLYCAKCGAPVTGVSGTSKTGATHSYYYCANTRKHACTLPHMRQDALEGLVQRMLGYLLGDSELTASLAVDAAAYYAEHYADTGYLDGLKAQERDIERQLDNFTKAIARGIFNDSTAKAMDELEQRRAGVKDAIDAETARCALASDEHSVKAYFERYWKAGADDVETRDYALDYLVDKLVVDEDGIDVVSWFTDTRAELAGFDWTQLSGLDGYSPFARGEAAEEFDFFPVWSTIGVTVELFFVQDRAAFRFQRRPRLKRGRLFRARRRARGTLVMRSHRYGFGIPDAEP